ncbi:MAG: circularly permuted type 2 ATP-grasp protein [Chitinophagaceae bacterium]
MIPDVKQDALFDHYSSIPHFYDELLDADGNPRPNWKTFFQSFSKLGNEEIMSRSQDMLRLLKENGVTYNIYDDPAGLNRPWKLDLLPFLINKEEWQKIESGLIQRARLLDLVLKDIYGNQELIKLGLLPMELVYNHAGFLRQCCGIKQPGQHNLIFYAADIARSADGKIWIVNDRTQAPSGSGYALENRMAMARILPELFNGLKVRRLSTYFNALRNALIEIAPGKNPNPRIVILTPGPNNETYFEHSFLASFLGYTLVQGNDLMVKDNYVWLKTLSGLEKVDVILRRVDDVYCDPLELREDSQLGVPGLVHVLRCGNVSIANPLGSSVLENPGLMPFLNNIAKHLLGEELILPTIASWWCGQPEEMTYVLDNIKSLVIKKIFKDSTRSTSIDGASLSTKQVAALKERIKAHPAIYVGQEKIKFSSTPSLVTGKVEPRNALFRSFLVSSNEGYIAMTGGLTRTTANPGNFIISNQQGGISKDTWIISPEPGRILNVRKELERNYMSTHSGALPSHTAENLFWVGRYTERVLGNARFLRTVMQFIAEGNNLLADNETQSEQNLLMALTHFTNTYPGFTAGDDDEKFKYPWKELRDTLFNEKRPNSLSANLLLFKKAVYSVRDHWSTDTWRVLRSIEEEWANVDAAPATGHHRMLSALDNLITSMVAFIGLNRESISREQGWVMLDTGRKMEQSLLLITMLLSSLVKKHDDQTAYDLQEAILVSNESLVNYRYKYRAHIQLPLVLDLMLLDPNNPRSLIYQLDRLKAYLSQLPKSQSAHTLAEHERLVLEAYTLLKLADKDALAICDIDTSRYENLHTFLSAMHALLLAIPGAVSKIYFKHATTQKQLFSADIASTTNT